MKKKGFACCIAALLSIFCAQLGWAQFGVFEEEIDWPQIGNVKLPGNTSVSGSGDDAVYTVQGNGNGLSAVTDTDEAYFVYKDMTGSWSLQALVSWDDPTGIPFGTVGLMIRDDEENPSSRYYSLVLRSDETSDRLETIFRNLYFYGSLQNTEHRTPDDEPIYDQGNGIWLRVTHIAPLQLFIGEYSFDGEEWVLAHIQVLPWGNETLAYGVMISNDEDNDFMAQAQLRNVEFLSAFPVAERTLSKAAFTSEDTIDVSIELFNPGDPAVIVIQETIPQGWTPANISHDGTFADGVITWNLADVATGNLVLTYQAIAPASPEDRADWTGTIVGGLEIQGKSGLLFSGGDVERITDGLLALYTFKEGDGDTVHDVSEAGDPLNLTISNPSNVEWGQGFLAVNGAVKIRSGDPATKLIEGIQETNEITVEAWIAPANDVQSGPARIVTLSYNASLRNFTLGQAGTEYRFRIRTPDTGNNGSNPELRSPPDILTTVLTHVVYTRDDYWATSLYVNGDVVVNDDNILDIIDNYINGDITGWDDTYEFGLANEINEERPWLGDLHLVAVYNKPLSEDEIGQNFAAGPSAGPGFIVDVANWSLY